MKLNLVTFKDNHIVNPDWLNSDSLWIDAGAGVGKSILYFPVKCKIIAIEPDKDNYEKLVNNVKAGIYYNKALVGTKKDYVPFYKVKGKYGWGSITKINKGEYVYNVPTMTLDELPKADYIKLDIEGAEWEVIRNMSYFPKQMSIEIHQNKEEIIYFLGGQGYRLAEFPHNELYVWIP